MRKIGIVNFREFHLSRWHPASTAPYNQDLELRITEDGATTRMPFPCRHTNEDEWINVDLGVPVQIQPVEWRAWRQSRSPQPHQASIFASDTSASRRLEQWSRLHEHLGTAFPATPATERTQ